MYPVVPRAHTKQFLSATNSTHEIVKERGEISKSSAVIYLQKSCKTRTLI